MVVLWKLTSGTVLLQANGHMTAGDAQTQRVVVVYQHLEGTTPWTSCIPTATSARSREKVGYASMMNSFPISGLKTFSEEWTGMTNARICYFIGESEGPYRHHGHDNVTYYLG